MRENQFGNDFFSRILSFYSTIEIGMMSACPGKNGSMSFAPIIMQVNVVAHL